MQSDSLSVGGMDSMLLDPSIVCFRSNAQRELAIKKALDWKVIEKSNYDFSIANRGVGLRNVICSAVNNQFNRINIV